MPASTDFSLAKPAAEVKTDSTEQPAPMLAALAAGASGVQRTRPLIKPYRSTHRAASAVVIGAEADGSSTSGENLDDVARCLQAKADDADEQRALQLRREEEEAAAAQRKAERQRAADRCQRKREAALKRREEDLGWDEARKNALKMDDRSCKISWSELYGPGASPTEVLNARGVYTGAQVRHILDEALEP